MADEEENIGIDMDVLGWQAGKLAGAAQEEKEIFELVVSVQRAGNERGKRIYFDSKSVEEIREKCGDDFFLFSERTLLAFIDPSEGKITLTSLKGVYKNYL
jgi:hypothetical protein